MTHTHRLPSRKNVGELKKIPSEIKMLAIIFLFAEFSLSIAVPLVPVFIQETLGNYAYTGILIAALGITMIAIDIPLGRLMDFVGRKFFVAIGSLVRILVAFGYSASSNFYHFFAVRILGGVEHTLVWSPAWATVRDKSPKGKESECIALFNLGAISGGIIGALIGGLIAMQLGLVYVFWAWAIIGAFVAIVVQARFPETLKKREPVKKGIKDFFRKHRVRKSFSDIKRFGKREWTAMLLMLFYATNITTLFLMVPLLADALQANYFLIAAIFALMTLPAVIQYIFAKTGDRIGEKNIIMILALIAIPFSIALAFTQTLLMLFVLSLILSLITFAIMPNVFGMATTVFPKKKEGELTGINQLFQHSGMLIGPLAAGLLAQYFWVGAPFLFMTAIFILMVVVASRF